MDSINTVTMIAIVLALIAVVLAAYAISRTRRTARLQSQFGPEYDNVVHREGNQSRAEAELQNREARVKRFNIRPLSAHERERFAESWRQQQGRFVDDPRTAVLKADTLITEVMTARGYPVSDFKTISEDLSVEHSHIIGSYRGAHEIAERSSRGTVETEELRSAMISYRSLFEDLLGTRVVEPEREHVEVRR